MCMDLLSLVRIHENYFLALINESELVYYRVLAWLDSKLMFVCLSKPFL